MKKDEMAKFFEEYAKLWCAHKADEISALHDENCEFDDKPRGEVIKGREALREFLKFSFEIIPDLKMTVVRVLPGDNFAVFEWRFSGTPVDHPKVKLKQVFFDQPVGSIVEFQNGKIKYTSDYLDISPLLP